MPLERRPIMSDAKPLKSTPFQRSNGYLLHQGPDHTHAERGAGSFYSHSGESYFDHALTITNSFLTASQLPALTSSPDARVHFERDRFESPFSEFDGGMRSGRAADSRFHPGNKDGGPPPGRTETPASRRGNVPLTDDTASALRSAA